MPEPATSRKPRVLVVGGAGYIGSHMVKLLCAAGVPVTTLDDLSSGLREAVLGGDFVEASLADADQVDALFARGGFDAVMHFASFIQVGESVREPAMYYRNNVCETLMLLEAMIRHDVRKFVFSSSAAVYGEPVKVPIDETHPKSPGNPYGRTKLMVEEILDDFDRAYGLRSIRFRYFNAAGADPDGELGENHDPESHLIPLVLRAASGRLPQIDVFGDDYDTPDGTCIRDYVHVSDLCDAHLLAVQALMDGAESQALNLGNGNGFSVREVIDTASSVTGTEIPMRIQDRRPGDPARLVADATRAKADLGWSPRYPDLDAIIGDAWRWEQRLAAAGGKPSKVKTP